MKNNNYPTWLVPLDIAKELKEIGFHELVQNSYYSNKGTECILSSTLRLEKKSLADANILNFLVSLPTWEQIFEWFREKGFESYIRLESHAHFDEGNYYYFEITKSNLRQLDWQGDFDDYNEAREALVKALIRTYKNEQL
jgi:hypothetical protein|nr:MAG TPA: hypothetical protein [Caudoviricetes sp.]